MIEPSVPGRVCCMKCGKDFFSRDRLRLRRCGDCKKNEAVIYAPIIIRVKDLDSHRGPYRES